MTILTFRNKHQNPVHIFWKKQPTDQELLYSILKPGEFYKQGSGEGDTWLIRDAANDRLLDTIIAKTDEEINIKEQVLRLPVAESTWDQLDTTYRPYTLHSKNYALNFDGNDVVTVPSSSSLNLQDNWTLEAWVFRHEKNVQQTVMEKAKRQAGEGGFALQIGANNKVQGGFFDGTDFIYAEGKTELEGKCWYHLAVSFDAKSYQIKCYVNGQLDGTELFISPDPDSNYTVLQFDRKNDYIAVPNINVSETKYTLCLWFKSEEPNCGLFSVDAGVRGEQGHDRDIYLENGNLCAQLGQRLPEIIKTSGTNYADGYWHQVTHVFGESIGGQRLYVDGKRVASGNAASSDFSGQTGINIGFSKAASHPYYSGQLTEVSIWMNARSEEEIQSRWRQKLRGDEPGLQGLWRLDEGQGATYHDATSNECHAVLEESTSAKLGYISVGSAIVEFSGSALALLNRGEGFTISTWAWGGDSRGTDTYILIQARISEKTIIGRIISFSGISSEIFGRKCGPMLAEDEWNHVCIVLARSAYTVYINGLMAFRDFLTGFSGSLGYCGLNYLIKLRGCIPETSVWATLRTQKQIFQEMETGLIGTETGLISFWNMTRRPLPSQAYYENGYKIEDLSKYKSDLYLPNLEKFIIGQQVDRPYGLHDRTPRWNHYSELRLLPALDLVAKPSTAQRLKLGSGGKDDSTPFKGALDSMRIWNLTRTDDQIRSTWNQILRGDESGLKAYYRFDEGAGNVLIDQTANANNGTLGDNNAQFRPAWVESSLLLMDGVAFDGQDDYIALPEMEVDYSKGFTVEAWVYFESFKNWSRIIDLGNGQPSDNIILANTGNTNKLNFSIYSGSNLQFLEVENFWKLHQWIHVAATVDASGFARIYQNGVEVKTGQLHLPNFVKRSKNYIGRSNWTENDYFHGRMDEIRLWKTVRTPELIQGYMRRILSPADSRLVVLYSFDEGYGGTAFDSSANSFHGFLGEGDINKQPTWQRVWEPDDMGLKFDGQGDYVQLPEMEIDFSRGFTIEVWVYYDSFKSWSRIIELGNGQPSDNIILGNKDTSSTLSLQIYRGNNSEYLEADNVFELHHWTHVAVTVDDRGNTTIYKYGNSVKTGKLNLPNNVKRQNNYFGRSNWTANSYFHGHLDEIRLWTVVRTPVQIQSNIRRRLAPGSEGLAAYWPVDTGAGTILYDKTINAYHGKLGGGQEEHMPKWAEASAIQFQGFEFNGVTEYIKVDSKPEIDLTTNFTISAWLKPNSFQGMHTLVSKVTDVQECQYALSLDGEQLRFDYETDGNNYALVGGRIGNGWHHVAVTVETYTSEIEEASLSPSGEIVTQVVNDTVSTINDQGETVTYPVLQERVIRLNQVTVNRPKITLYIDGLRVISGFAPKETKASAVPLHIGAWGVEEKEHFFNGVIDVVAIRSKRLTQEEIHHDMHRRLGNSTPEVAGYWRLQQNLVLFDRVSDLSGSHNDGVLLSYVQFGADDQYLAQGTLELSGDHSKVVLQRPVSLNEEWTIEANFKLPLRNNNPLAMTFLRMSLNVLTFGSNEHQVIIRKISEKIDLGSLNNGQFVPCGSDLSKLEHGWHHLAAVGLAGRTDFYIDGGKVGTVPFQSRTNVSIIGNDSNGLWVFGSIDEVRIWNYAREEAEILAQMRQSLVGTETGLMGYWRFEEGSGTTVKDLTPYRNHGTIEGNYTWKPGTKELGLIPAVWEQDPDIDALEFNGSNQYVSMGNLGVPRAAGQPLTLMAWVKSSTDSDGHRVIAGARSGNQFYRISQQGKKWHFGYSNNNKGGGTENGSVSPNQWTHVAGVYDGNSLHLYVNGEQVDSKPNFPDLSIGDFSFAVGRRADHNSEFFQGQISEVSVWTTALSLEDVQRYIKQTLIGTEAELVGYWNFTEQKRNVAHDRSGRGKNGTLQGNPTWMEVTELSLKTPPACLGFNGSDQYVDLVTSGNLELSDDDFTVEAWIKPESLAGYRTVLGADDSDSQPGLLLGIRDSKAYMRLANNSEFTSSRNDLKQNEWQHFVWQYAKATNQVKIFVNGQLAKEAIASTPYRGTGLMRVARQGNGNYFKGCIADLRVWDTLRTGNEIGLNMYRRLSGTEPGLLGYWRLNEIEGPYAMDSTPWKNHGVLYNCRRFPLELPVMLSTAAILKMPTKQDLAVQEYIETLPIPETPETRPLATEVVPSPSAQNMVTTLTVSSEGQSDPNLQIVNLNTVKLPEPLKSLANKLQAAINKAGTLPESEIRLTSDLLAPLDPFSNLFGFKAEFLIIKNPTLQVIGSAATGTTLSANVGLRLSGEVSFVGLESTRVEADFYKGKNKTLLSYSTSQQTNNSQRQSGQSGKTQSTQIDQSKSTQPNEQSSKSASSALSYLIKFHLSEPIGLGTIVKGVPLIGGIKFYKPAKEYESDESKRLLALIVTNDENSSINLVSGLNAYGTVRVASSDDPVFKFIGNLFGVQEIQLHVAAAPKQFNLDAVTKYEVELIKDKLWFKETGVSLQVITTPPEFTASVSATFEAYIDQQKHKFIGQLGVTVGKGATLNGALVKPGDWNKPFGLEGVAIANVAGEIAGRPDAPWIARLGFTGKLAIGKTSVMLAIMVDTNDPQKCIFVADAENIKLGDIVSSLCGPDVLAGDKVEFLNSLFSIHKLKISIVPKACSIGKINFKEEGIIIQIAVTILGINADLYVRVDYTEGVTAYATLSPISIAGGLLEISESRNSSGTATTRLLHCPTHVHNISAETGNCQEVLTYACPDHDPTHDPKYKTSNYAAFCLECAKENGGILTKKMEPYNLCNIQLQPKRGPQFYLRLSPCKLPEYYLSGYASLLGISVDALVSFSQAGLDANLQGNIWGLFRASLQVKTPHDFSSLYIKAELHNDFFTRIREAAVKKIREVADKAVNEISGAQDKIRGAQREVDRLLTKIDETRAQIRREREAVVRKFQEAQWAIDGAQRKVDSILGEIENTKRYYGSLPGADWPWKPSKAREWIWVGPKLAGLYVAYGVATGVLWTARKVLEGLAWVTQQIPIDMDPRILALFVAYGVATAALKVADGVLEGTKYVVKGAAYIAEQITRLALGELFDIRYAMFEGHFGGPDAAYKVQILARIVFLKQNLEIKFLFDKNDIAGSIGSFVTGLISEYAPG